MSNLDGYRNPYAPPTADLGGSDVSLHRRFAWKIYLLLMIVLMALLFAFEGAQWIQTADVIDLAVFAIATVGLFGFAYRRRIGSRTFWSMWLPVEVVWDFAVLLAIEPAGFAYRFPDGERTAVFSVETAVGVLLVLPLYIALYRYAFRSPELWAAV